MGPGRGSLRPFDPTGVGRTPHHGSRRRQRGDRSATASRSEDRPQLRKPPLSQARSQQPRATCHVPWPTRTLGPEPAGSDSTHEPRGLESSPGRFRPQQIGDERPAGSRRFRSAAPLGTDRIGEYRQTSGSWVRLRSPGSAHSCIRVVPVTPSLRVRMARDRDAEEGAQLSEQTLDMRRVLWLLRRQRPSSPPVSWSVR